MKLLYLILLCLLLVSVNGCQTGSQPLATAAPTVAPSPLIPVATSTATLEVSPTPVATATPTATPTPQPSPTPTADLSALAPISSTLPITTSAGVPLLDFCQVTPVSPPPAEAMNDLYYNEFRGWFHTTDQFKTSEQVAPHGYLSHDLRYLVTLDCQGIGTVCMASPPTAEPEVLATYPNHYSPDSLDGSEPSSRGWWLADNKRLILVIMTPHGDGSHNADRFVYVLDAEHKTFTPIIYYIGDFFAVARNGSCLATMSVDRSDKLRFYVIAVREDGSMEAWTPSDRAMQSAWSDYGGTFDWSYDGTRIAYDPSLYEDNSIYIFDLRTGKQEEVWIPQGNVSSFTWSPDDRLLFMESWPDNLIYAFDSQSYLHLPKFNAGGKIFIHWLPDSLHVILPDAIVGTRLYSVEDRSSPLLEFPGSNENSMVYDFFLGQP